MVDTGTGSWRSSSLYLGAGAGVAIPYLEVELDGKRTEGYQLAGPAAQVFVGASLPLGKRFSISAEYRFSWARLDTDLSGFGSLGTDAATHHLNFGIRLQFQRAGLSQAVVLVWRVFVKLSAGPL